MKTTLLYLEDTYLFQTSAKFLEIKENEKGKAVILDKTIFYPQGGGQPSDTGYIRNDSGIFKVNFVGLDPEGLVWHFGEFESGSFSNNHEINLEIDKEKRLLNARVHSAGHLIDCVVQGMIPQVKLNKGFHFSEGPYIEGVGTVVDLERFKNELEKKVNELILENISVRKENLTEVEAKERGITAPPGKSVRLIGFGNYKECGCGGTHVNTSKEVNKITIRKVSSKDGKTKVSYSVQ